MFDVATENLATFPIYESDNAVSVQSDKDHAGKVEVFVRSILLLFLNQLNRAWMPERLQQIEKFVPVRGSQYVNTPASACTGDIPELAAMTARIELWRGAIFQRHIIGIGQLFNFLTA